MTDWKDELKARAIRRQKKLNEKHERLLQIIESGRIDRDPSGETERQWLEGFAGEGKLGLNLCCGNFSIGDTYGVDGNRRLLGTDMAMDIDKVYTLGQNTFDCVITNHVESTINPSNLFFSIYGILKSTGVLAIVFVDSDYSDEDMVDIIMSDKKVSLFNRTTMKYYLLKAGFKDVEISKGSSPTILRALAKK